MGAEAFPHLRLPSPGPTGGLDGVAAPEPLLLRPREAARFLAISERTLWELTRRGEILCVRLGRAVRYDRRDLLAAVERLKRDGPVRVTDGDG
jgi:excisionase family DNA binding protein